MTPKGDRWGSIHVTAIYLVGFVRIVPYRWGLRLALFMVKHYSRAIIQKERV